MIPPRSFIHQFGQDVGAGIRNTHSVFMRFKTGEAGLAYPLALGMHQALKQSNAVDFKAIVPIPLSPDKAAAGEIHRTRLLAKELSALSGIPVHEALSLSHPISKRRFLRDGASIQEFEAAYGDALEVDTGMLVNCANVLLVDDVCTGGSTLAIAARALEAAYEGVQVAAATAAQMIIKAAVRDPSPLLVPSGDGV